MPYRQKNSEINLSCNIRTPFMLLLTCFGTKFKFHKTKLYGRNSLNISVIYTWNYLRKLNENNIFYHLSLSKFRLLKNSS